MNDREAVRAHMARAGTFITSAVDSAHPCDPKVLQCLFELLQALFVLAERVLPEEPQS